jgi:hypothetical protein
MICRKCAGTGQIGDKLCAACQMPVVTRRKNRDATIAFACAALNSKEPTTPPWRLLWLVLALEADQCGEVVLSNAELSKKCRMSGPAVWRAMKGLTGLGLIERENRTGGRGNCAIVRLKGFANALP